MNQTLEKKDKKTVDTLKIGIYAIYDTVLQQFEYPFSCPESKINEYMSMLVNDSQSKYWLDEDSYILNKIATFSQDTGEIIQCSIVERIQFLDKYIDNNKRQLQTIVQTLNYLPSGYFKMPKEQKDAIQTRIDDAITNYVQNYVVPDIDINSAKENLYYERGIDFVKKLRQFTEETHWDIPDSTCSALDDVIDEFFEFLGNKHSL